MVAMVVMVVRGWGIRGLFNILDAVVVVLFRSLFPIVIVVKRRKGHPVQVDRVLVPHVWTGKWTCAR